METSEERYENLNSKMNSVDEHQARRSTGTLCRKETRRAIDAADSSPLLSAVTTLHRAFELMVVVGLKGFGWHCCSRNSNDNPPSWQVMHVGTTFSALRDARRLCWYLPSLNSCSASTISGLVPTYLFARLSINTGSREAKIPGNQ